MPKNQKSIGLFASLAVLLGALCVRGLLLTLVNSIQTPHISH